MAYFFPKGSTIKAGDELAADHFETIIGVRNIQEQGLSAEQLDATSHDTVGSFRDLIQGLKGWGTFTFEMLWDPGDDIHIQLFDDFKAGTERYYQLEINDSVNSALVATFLFKGFVSDYSFAVPFDALLTANVQITVKATPAPTLTPAP